jgi:hypothetical protein
VLEGWGAGLLFGFFLSIVIAASTRLRCPLPLAMRSLALALTIVAIAWLVGGIVGVALALIRPQLWGTFFVGVPSRLYATLPRYAWVAGSITGAYAGVPISLVAASITLHLRWRRMQRPLQAFPVLPAAQH